MKFVLTSKYGALEEVRNFKPHTGVDIRLPEGTELSAIQDAIVERVVDYGATNIGKGVILKLHDGSHAIYGHLSHINVKEGALVKAGQTIGLSGNTGHTTGAHLHFALKDNANHFVDPTNVALSIKGPLWKAAEKGGEEAVDHLGPQFVNGLLDMIGSGAHHLIDLLTLKMPFIGGITVLACGLLMLITGDVSKYLARCFVGLTGVIVWLMLV
jgi:hypothetical protein